MCYFEEVMCLASAAFISAYKLASNDSEILAADQLFYGYGTFFTNWSTVSIMMKYNQPLEFDRVYKNYYATCRPASCQVSCQYKN